MSHGPSARNVDDAYLGMDISPLASGSAGQLVSASVAINMLSIPEYRVLHTLSTAISIHSSTASFVRTLPRQWLGKSEVCTACADSPKSKSIPVSLVLLLFGHEHLVP